jgi:membrane protein implicated in regulation of membrane protease activity
VLEFAEPLVAAIAGLVLAVVGLAGWVTGDKLAAATLFVLTVVAISLLRERSLRVNANQNIEALGGQLAETTDAVNAIQSGNPYSVLLHETTWDIDQPDGSLVYATRLKKIRIDQNNVFALYDFASGDGEISAEYSPGTRRSKFLGHGGRDYDLIDLGRIYNRGERLDFEVKRTVRDGFKAEREVVAVDTLDATERMVLRILWPAGCPPTALRLGRGTPSHEWRSEDVIEKLDTSAERAKYEVEIDNPARGGSTTIEWEWNPEAPTAAVQAPPPVQN